VALAFVAALTFVACVPTGPTDTGPGGGGNGSGNGSGNGNGNNVTVNVIISGNVPGSGTGTGSTAGCAAIADIGGKLYGSNEQRDAFVTVNNTVTGDFTPKDAAGNIRTGDCDKNTPVDYVLSSPPGVQVDPRTVCQVLANPSNPYLPSVKGLSKGVCILKAKAAGVETSDAKAFKVTVQ
jgi:hypothetical protein